MSESVKQILDQEPKRWVRNLMTVIVLMVLFLTASKSVEFNGLHDSGLSIAKNIFFGIFTPDTGLLFNLTRQGVPYLLLETLSIAFLGTIFGAILAIPLAFVSATNMVPKWVSYLGAIVIVAIRTFPAFVYGLVFIRVTGPGPMTGVLTLAVESIGMIAKLYIESIEELDGGIIEALDASGCNTYQKIRYGIIPQLTSNFLSTVIYRYEINIKNASILGLVGAGGIGAPLVFAMSAYRWHEVGSILIGLIVIVIIVEMFSSKLRNRLARGF